MAAETATAWSLVALSPWPLSWRLTAAACLVAAAAAALWRSCGPGHGALVALRVLGVGAALALLWEPAIERRTGRRVVSRLAVVVDTSESMALAQAGGLTRSAAGSAFWAVDSAERRAMAEHHPLSWHDLEGPTGPEALRRPPLGQKSDLVTALERAVAPPGGAQPPAALVLVSDGADSLLADDSLSPTTLARLRGLQVPVSVVAAGTAGPFIDVRIEPPINDGFAFLHNSMALEARVVVEGLERVEVPVTLKREGEVVATQTVTVDGGQPAKVAFQLKPDKLGEFIFTLSTPVRPEEAIAYNNAVTATVRVIRDKVRILHVAGRPSWDERFLRQHLKDSPNADVISFFILRTPSDEALVPESELALIPFPVAKLFTTELESFDVIILQNFDFRPYHMGQYLPNLRDAVRAGLGFVLVGGDEALGAGGDGGSPLQDILPVEVRPAPYLDLSCRPELTAAGSRHPVTDLSLGGGGPQAPQLGLPAWTGLNPVGPLRPGATLLAEGRCGPQGAEARPLIAAMEAGKGRSLLIASDASWRWRFAADDPGGNALRAYHRLWANALRWLVRDPAHARVRLVPRRRQVAAGEAAELVASAVGPAYEPAPGVELTVRIEASGGRLVHQERVRTGADGSARVVWARAEAGAYRARAVAQEGRAELGEAEAVLTVADAHPELHAAAPRPKFLAAIAAATGGKVLAAAPGSWARIPTRADEVVAVDRREDLELWDRPAALLVTLGLWASEWALRRRRGLA